MRHNFSGNVVYTSSSHASNAVVRSILDGNEFGVLIQMNSGLPVNLLSNRDLNGDGVNSDRPLNIGRDSLYLPNRYNVDGRWTRFVPLRGSVRAEIIAELKNIFNTQQTSAVGSTIATDPAGNPTIGIPSDTNAFTVANGFAVPSGYEQRKFQLGFRLRF
jgi:hypothetical protein